MMHLINGRFLVHSAKFQETKTEAEKSLFVEISREGVSEIKSYPCLLPVFNGFNITKVFSSGFGIETIDCGSQENKDKTVLCRRCYRSFASVAFPNSISDEDVPLNEIDSRELDDELEEGTASKKCSPAINFVKNHPYITAGILFSSACAVFGGVMLSNKLTGNKIEDKADKPLQPSGVDVVNNTAPLIFCKVAVLDERGQNKNESVILEPGDSNCEFMSRSKCLVFNSMDSGFKSNNSDLVKNYNIMKEKQCDNKTVEINVMQGECKVNDSLFINIAKRADFNENVKHKETACEGAKFPVKIRHLKTKNDYIVKGINKNETVIDFGKRIKAIAEKGNATETMVLAIRNKALANTVDLTFKVKCPLDSYSATQCLTTKICYTSPSSFNGIMAYGTRKVTFNIPKERCEYSFKAAVGYDETGEQAVTNDNGKTNFCFHAWHSMGPKLALQSLDASNC